MKDDLKRFLDAHQDYYQMALEEVRSGKKKGHWMWFIFPQIAGLGRSSTARYYAIRDMEEAKEFIEDATLGRNLIEISQALLDTGASDASALMGYPDDLKLRSSMTLFALAKPECEVFRKVLDRFFQGEMDQRTVDILSGQ